MLASVRMVMGRESAPTRCGAILGGVHRGAWHIVAGRRTRIRSVAFDAAVRRHHRRDHALRRAAVSCAHERFQVRQGTPQRPDREYAARDPDSARGAIGARRRAAGDLWLVVAWTWYAI